MTLAAHSFSIRSVSIVCCLTIVICASPSPFSMPWDIDDQKPDDASLADPTPPPEVSDALSPRTDLGLGASTVDLEPRFDVTVDRAPARQFFMSLVEGTAYSIALAPGVEGESSLSRRDVSVEEVLDTLQQA